MTDFRHFDPANPPADYRSWVLAWRRIYKAFSAYRRAWKLDRRLCWSRHALKAERGKESLERALAEAQAKVPMPLPVELTSMRRYTWETGFFPYEEFAHEMLLARATGKEWYKAQKAGAPSTS